jgi:cytochrome P450
MMCHQLGINPPPGREQATFLEMYALGEELISPLRLYTRRLSGAQLAKAKGIYAKLMRPARDSADVAETSMVARLSAAGLSVEEVEGVLGALFVVGTQTVSTTLPRLVALLVDSGQIAALRARPELAQRAIDEGFRCIVPTPIMLRRVTEDVRVTDWRFRAGDRVVIATYNLAKASDLYPAPRRFDILRVHPSAGRHLWFGVGQHFCLGFALAQLEVRSVLDMLLGLPDDLEVVSRHSARGILIPAYRSLTVRLRRPGIEG